MKKDDNSYLFSEQFRINTHWDWKLCVGISHHTISGKLFVPWKIIPFLMEMSASLLRFANVIVFLCLWLLCSRLTLGSICPWLIGKIVVGWVRRLWPLPLFLLIILFLRVGGKRGKGDMCWQVADSWNLPVMWGRNVFVVFYGSDAIDEWTVSSVVDVQNGASS